MPRPLTKHTKQPGPAALPQASKKQYCVNKAAKAAPSVDAACEDLLKDAKVRGEG